MSYHSFLESQNKGLRDSLYEWQEKARQYSIVIEVKDKRINELESQVNHWKSNHDNQKTLKSQLMDRLDLKDRAQSIWKLYKRIAELEGKTDFPDWNQWFKENLQQNK